MSEIVFSKNGQWRDAYNSILRDKNYKDMRIFPQGLREMETVDELLLYKDEGVVKGFLAFHKRKRDSIVVIYDIFVKNIYSSQGIGTLLLKFLESFSQVVRCKVVKGVRSNSFWLKNGYSIIEEVPRGEEKRKMYQALLILEKVIKKGEGNGKEVEVRKSNGVDDRWANQETNTAGT